MIQPYILDEIAECAAEAGLRVRGSEDQLRDARVDERSGAHCARLERYHHRRPFQPPVADRFRCFRDGDELRVPEGIAGFAAVPAAADDLAIAIDDDGADRNLARRAR